MRAGRGDDADQVRASLAYQARHVWIGPATVGVGVRLGALGNDVDQPDQLRAAGPGIRPRVLMRDVPAPDNGDPERAALRAGQAGRHGAIMPRPTSPRT